MTIPIKERGYAHPDVLVSTDWVAQHLADPDVRIMESDEDLLLYEIGHIPGAVKVDWVSDLNDPVTRDYISQERLQQLLRSKGVNSDTTMVLYGDKNNWWATYTFWVFRLFGLNHMKIMDGGRLRWQQEQRPLDTNVPRYPQGDIAVPPRDVSQLKAALGSLSADRDRRARLAHAAFGALKKRDLLGVALDRFEAYKQTISLDNAVPFVTALFDIGDDLPDIVYIYGFLERSKFFAEERRQIR